MYTFFKRHFLYMAWVLALTATLLSFIGGKLYHLPICELCWYQRIFLYPLALILGIAAYHNDRSITRYALPFVYCGLLMSLYQYAEQMYPSFFPISVCGGAMGNCSTPDFVYANFITWAFLNALLNVLILSVLWIGKKS